MRVRLLLLGRIVAVLAALNICGGQWIVLQSVAWSGMLIKYSQNASLTEALAKTFDGNHPCNLCKGIERTKKDSDQKQNIPVEKKLELKCLTAFRARILYPPAAFDLQPVFGQAVIAWTDTPPVPPPRTALS